MLRDDGLIFVSIDEREYPNLRKIMDDDIYGESNYIGDLVWESVTQPVNAGDAKYSLQKKTEMILIYAKDKNKVSRFTLRNLGISYNYPDDGKHGKCRFEIIEKSDSGSYNRESMKFKILGQDPLPGKRWQIGEQLARQLEKEGKFDVDAEDDPPTIVLTPENIDYLREKMSSKIKRIFANEMGEIFLDNLLKNNKLIIKQVNGIENLNKVKTGALITCNHFNPFDCFTVEKVFRMSENEKDNK